MPAGQPQKIFFFLNSIFCVSLLCWKGNELPLSLSLSLSLSPLCILTIRVSTNERAPCTTTSTILCWCCHIYSHFVRQKKESVEGGNAAEIDFNLSVASPRPRRWQKWISFHECGSCPRKIHFAWNAVFFILFCRYNELQDVNCCCQIQIMPTDLINVRY